ncbi:MAG: integral rane sensor signal transduction histidine kinase [Bacillales bacterium]|jgi:two-component system, sporulation sensor kinase D|nr:integral rane sensor signal transduction histidine kinase [Bacillales bacterium]
MKIISKNMLKYFSLIIIVPNILFGLIFYFHIYTIKIQESKDFASNYLTHEAQYFNHVLGLAVGDLRSIRSSINDNHSKEYFNFKLRNLLIDKNRYHGIYLYNSVGDYLGGSDTFNYTLSSEVNKDYGFHESLKRKKTVGSVVLSNQFRGKNYIKINTPILNSDGKPKYVLVGLLKYQFIEDLGMAVNDESSFKLLQSDNKIIYETSNKIKYNNQEFKSFKLEELNWKIAMKPRKVSTSEIINFIIPFQTTFFFFTLVLFISYCMFRYRDESNNYKELINSQKLELIGQLAAGTAHEIRNPLTGIKGLVSLISEKHKDDLEDQFYIKVIQDEITRINEIVSEFMILGKPTAEITNTYNLNDILKEVEPVVRSESYLKSIDYVHSCYNDILPINCSKDHLKQIILNLSKNAIDAMDHGGLLTITSSKDNNYVYLKIIDNGCGIDEEIIQKLFQPFFTTKDTGTGLGLIVCRRLIESYGGSIVFDSIIHEGTTVTVKLPIAK